MSHAHEHPTVPLGAKLFGGGLVLFALALVVAVQLGWMDKQAVPAASRVEASATPLASRDLRFAMGSEDALTVEDVASGEVIARYAQSEGGFVRGSMRGLGRERMIHGVSADTPYTLTRWSDGSISLTDHGTGETVELGAFGADNRAAFEALLEDDV